MIRLIRAAIAALLEERASQADDPHLTAVQAYARQREREAMLERELDEGLLRRRDERLQRRSAAARKGAVTKRARAYDPARDPLRRAMVAF